MKKAVVGVLASFLAVAGCTPSVDQVKATGMAVGYAAGIVANESGIKDDARNAVVEILGEVRGFLPGKGESFVDAWTPVIKEKVAELVSRGKIDAATGELVSGACLLAAKGVDYLFDVRFPKAREYADLVSAGAGGAIDGFLAVFKPVNAKSVDDVEYDKEAYKWLKTR